MAIKEVKQKIGKETEYTQRPLVVAKVVLATMINQRIKYSMSQVKQHHEIIKAKNGPEDDDGVRGPNGDVVVPGPPRPDGGTYPSTPIPDEEKYIPDEIKPSPAPQPPKGEIIMGPDDGDDFPTPPEPLSPGEVMPVIPGIWTIGTPDGDRVIVELPDEQEPLQARMGPIEDPEDPNKKEPSFEEMEEDGTTTTIHDFESIPEVEFPEPDVPPATPR